MVAWFNRVQISRGRPIGRCPECGSCYKMEYVGPEHVHRKYRMAHDAVTIVGEGLSNLYMLVDAHRTEPEPTNFSDFIKPEYRYR